MIWALILIALVIGLAVTYWYVAIPVAVLGLGGLLYYRWWDKTRLTEMTPEERAVELERRADSRERRQGTYKGITVVKGRITTSDDDWPVAGAVARVESAGEITSRLSATRIGLLGPLGFFARKRIDKRELYLTVQGPGWSIVKELNADTDGASARSFAGKINAAASAEPVEAVPPALPPAQATTEVLRELGQLRNAGVITPDEFTAKKTELLGRL